MTNLTVQQVIEKGGKEWVKGEISRVYMSQDLFNEATGQQVSLNEKKWKFYVDANTNQFYRTNGKKPVLVK
tara:strand:- start:105 stop:317 length:213 start_codon:yes stop_codon:yes gene_type:complete